MKKITKHLMPLLALLPATVLAGSEGTLTENMGTLPEFLNSIQTWLLSIVGGLATLFIIYGGFLYLTSAGNKEKAETAKKTLTYAVLGLILVALSGLLLELITSDFLTSIFGNSSL